jgi:8-oxo-dGTP pyrophosphatase MutT (NUDIX family)
MPTDDNGNPWLAAWHPPDGGPPAGLHHGAAGVCVDPAGRIVLVSEDGVRWDFPAGRPEGDESPAETLRREVWEEACARVTTARLLGYTCGECLGGPEKGRVLHRSVWRAAVEVAPWEPRFEIAHRRLVTADEVYATVRARDHAWARIGLRILAEAGV